jgi:hypothetical protein
MVALNGVSKKWDEGESGFIRAAIQKMSLTILHVADKKVHFPHYPTPPPDSGNRKPGRGCLEWADRSAGVGTSRADLADTTRTGCAKAQPYSML